MPYELLKISNIAFSVLNPGSTVCPMFNLNFQVYLHLVALVSAFISGVTQISSSHQVGNTPCFQQYCVSRSWTDPKFPFSTQDVYSPCFRWLCASSCGTLVTWATFSPKSKYCTIVGLLRLRLWGLFFFGITLPTRWAECLGRKAVGH